MWWFVYLIITNPSGTPTIRQLPQTPAFHTEEQCTTWLANQVRSNRLSLASDVLATCMSPPEPASAKP